MSTIPFHRPGALTAALLIAMFAAAAAGLVFALWDAKGPAMFRALVENGLAWCF